MRWLATLALLSGSLALAQERRPEATSLLGIPLYSATPAPEALANLDAARAELEKSPRSADAIIWVGRRLGYLQRFREAIETFSRGIDLHRSDARLYRH